MTATAVLTARALLLDMDGTLVNSDASVERVWRRWADRNGLDGDEVMKVVHGRQGYASMALLLLIPFRALMSARDALAQPAR